jgi:undecaprenyl-diphosphatase
MIEWLDQLDKGLFLWLNSLHAPWADVLMDIITNKRTWYALYALFFGFILFKQRWRGLITIIFFLMAVGAADYLASGIFKPFFERFRPCHAPDLEGLVHVVGGCGKKFGFMSSHAATHFAMATFLWLSFRKQMPYLWLLFAWAALIAYSRVYVGVHYMGDILAGGLTGAGWGWLFFQANQQLTKRFLHVQQ